MPKISLKINASDKSHWGNWPQKKIHATGQTVRLLPTGKPQVLNIDGRRDKKSFVAVQFSSDLTPEDAKCLIAKFDNLTQEPFFNPSFPRFVLFCPSCLSEGSADLPIRFEIEHCASHQNAATSELGIAAIYYLPARGMFSKVWASKKRLASARKAGGAPDWHPEDFPYSHFDGVSYLSLNGPAAKSAAESGFSAIKIFLRQRNKSEKAIPIAWRTGPNPGNLSDILDVAKKTPKLEDKLLKLTTENEIIIRQLRAVQTELERSAQKEIKQKKEKLDIQADLEHTRAKAKEESDMLLEQLHIVQEELEQHFISNKDLKSEKEALVTEREALKKELEAAKAHVAEMQKKQAEFAAQLDSSAKEYGVLAAKCDTLLKELASAKTQAAEAEQKRTELEFQLKEKSDIQADLESKRTTAKEECDMLFKQLHMVQAEFEQHFISNKDLKSEKEALVTEREALKKDLEAAKAHVAGMQKKQAELAAQLDTRTKEQEALATEREVLKKDLEAAKAYVAEMQKKQAELAGQLEAHKAQYAVAEIKHAELASQLETHNKERDQIRSERDGVTKERDQLKKTAEDRAARIAELEAQVADQCERQRLIDEEMAKAEGQLEMLKEIFRNTLP